MIRPALTPASLATRRREADRPSTAKRRRAACRMRSSAVSSSGTGPSSQSRPLTPEHVFNRLYECSTRAKGRSDSLCCGQQPAPTDHRWGRAGLGAGGPGSVQSVQTALGSQQGEQQVLGILRGGQRALLGLEGPGAPQGAEHLELRIARAQRNRLVRSEEHTSELQSRGQLVCRLLLEKKNKHDRTT